MQKLSQTLTIISTISITLFSALSPMTVAHALTDDAHRLLISEVQTEGLQNGQPVAAAEFIELFNPHTEDITVHGWRLEYLSANHTGAGEPTRVVAPISGTIAARSFVLVSPAVDADIVLPALTTKTGYLARTGGHLRLVTNTSTLVDGVAWGTALALENEDKVLEIPAGMSIQRILPPSLELPDDILYALPSARTTPQAGGLSDPTEHRALPCKEIAFSEVMPNPKGVDRGHEFIELYNPTTETISLQGCSLRLGNAGRVYALPAEDLAPGAYRAFPDTETGLTLPNTTAPILFLLAAQDERQLTYPNNLQDDYAWAFVEGAWQATTRATPGLLNMASPPHPIEENKNPPSIQSVEPCPEGKERNTETNRCRTVAVAPTAPADCAAHQERNPGTGRCRTVPKPEAESCKASQERNPETNRCRNVLAASTNVACPPGQERNAETGRCRKVAPASAIATIQDVPISSQSGYGTFILAGVAVCIIIGYGVYEWRHDIANLLHKRKNTSTSE